MGEKALELALTLLAALLLALAFRAILKRALCKHNFGGPKNKAGYHTCFFCQLPLNEWLAQDERRRNQL